MSHTFRGPPPGGTWTNWYVEVKWFDDTDTLQSSYVELAEGDLSLYSDIPLDQVADTARDVLVNLKEVGLPTSGSDPIMMGRVYSISPMLTESHDYTITVP